MSLVQHQPQSSTLEDDVDLESMSLDQLAEQASSEHRQACEAVDEAFHHMSNGLYHAIRSGRALKVCRERIQDQSEWLTWLEATGVGQVTAKRYIRLAAYESVILDAGESMTIMSALRYLKGLPAATPKGRELSGEVVESMKRLHAQGETPRSIASVLGVSESGVRNHVVPGERERHRKAAARLRRQTRAERAAFAAKQEADAIKKAGGNISAAYSYVRKAAAELDAALGDATSPEVRTALRAALAGVHKAEDEIGKAVRSQ